MMKKVEQLDLWEVRIVPIPMKTDLPLIHSQEMMTQKKSKGGQLRPFFPGDKGIFFTVFVM